MRKTPSLEHLHRSPEGRARATPLLFVHGAYAGAWLWDLHYLPWFARRGWNAHALSFRGHGASAGRESLDQNSIDDYVADLARIIATLPAAPVVIAHSMGGFVLQKYLEQAELAGAVLLCSVPPQGLAGSALNLMLWRPDLLLELYRVIGGSSPGVDGVTGALFHQPLEAATRAACDGRFQPESMRAIWDMMGFDLPRPWAMRRPPMLLLGAARDRLIPPWMVGQTGFALDLPVFLLPGMGHAVMLERDWETGAQRIDAWLREEGF